ncbi:MAG: tetratricopeptide repeat protein [Bosea sp. (in: a-proteobacteria)]
MSDNFLREIDEEVRRDKAADLWKKYGNLIIALLVLLVAAVGGWRFWQHQQERAAQAISERLEGALKASRENRGEEAERTLADLSTQGSDGYRLVARFRIAAEAARREPADGAKAFDALANDATIEQVFRDLARIRSSMLKVDTAPYAEIKAALEPLAANNGTWRHTAREILGVSALKAQNIDDAGRWFDQIAIDTQAPQGLRQRVNLYLALVRAGTVEVK